MSKQIEAQELYDKVREEALLRAKARNTPPPSEIDIFKVVVAAAREAVFKGEAPREFLKELEQVEPYPEREKEKNDIKTIQYS